ncbi:DUF4920 domain-containing protein [Urechidicola croceus]|uniref:DUF4920 domain-containing protein n=1 Tax=Urechidicola croceus TaxID=1850246 RepID=A0A1D8P7H3_9FLAO|nr:DUF4920 domain-containing protein [Urechidicola croceus]AOW20514.1 DUF4920 domain-containing protein [Urechidicola croceus]
MKKFWILSLLVLVITSCKNDKKEAETQDAKLTYQSFGEKITSEGFITKEEMIDRFKTLKEGDTLDVKFASTVNSVCKAKGCWMKLDLGNNEESMVKFKDYGFFVPLNSDEREVIVHGKAFVNEVSIDEQRHYAKDAGKTNEEIAMITTPKFTYSFLADGVLMKEEVTSDE